MEQLKEHNYILIIAMIAIVAIVAIIIAFVPRNTGQAYLINTPSTLTTAVTPVANDGATTSSSSSSGGTSSSGGSTSSSGSSGGGVGGPKYFMNPSKCEHIQVYDYSGADQYSLDIRCPPLDGQERLLADVTFVGCGGDETERLVGYSWYTNVSLPIVRWYACQNIYGQWRRPSAISGFCCVIETTSDTVASMSSTASVQRTLKTVKIDPITKNPVMN